MKTRTSNIIAFIIAFATAGQFSYAEDGAASLVAHVHGLSELAIAMEGEKLEIQFTSPAMNLVGFEHQASSRKRYWRSKMQCRCYVSMKHSFCFREVVASTLIRR